MSTGGTMTEKTDLVERQLMSVISEASGSGCPSGLSGALHWAVFPGGSRMRPRICRAVNLACGGRDEWCATPAAAIELLHCASLVHDDLPCFDNSPTRRGRASVQAKFGERLAVLAGDALIVLAFQSLATGVSAERASTLAPLSEILAKGVSSPSGIAAGQAWECESTIDLGAYHRAKTGALFAAATMAGAAVAGVDDYRSWADLGLQLGHAYQVGDDILDAAGFAEDLGKPAHQDEALARPNSVAALGLSGAVAHLKQLIEQALASVPDCGGRELLCGQISAETDRILPKHLAALAA
jgi:geranylgeranyl diphosphate synthase type II